MADKTIEQVRDLTATAAELNKLAGNGIVVNNTGSVGLS